MASATIGRVKATEGLRFALGGAPVNLARGGYGCLLGPAGSGKATVLRRVCGLERWDVWFAGAPMAAIAPPRRRFALLGGGGMLAAWPTVGRAIGAALAWRGVARAARPRRMLALAEEFALSLAAEPARLAPDARLRARLALALAGDPVLLLADDPLAGCDDAAALAEVLRGAQRRRGLTVLHATSRPADAYALAHHLIVLEAGRVLQAGPTQRVYDRPESLAVAARLGPINVLPGRLMQIDDEVAMVRLDCGPVIEADPPEWATVLPARCQVLLRPERISVSRVAAAELGGAAIPAVLRDITGGGPTLRLAIAIGADAELAVLRPAALGVAGFAVGQTVSVAWQSQHALVFAEAA